MLTGKFDKEQLLYAFRQTDLDNSGEITASELKEILAKVGKKFTEQEISDLIATVDAKNNGSLSFPG